MAEEAKEVMDDMSLARGDKVADRLLVAEEAKEEKRDIPQGDAATVVVFFSFSFWVFSLWDCLSLMPVEL